MKKTKTAIKDEIIRFCKVLTQMKYDSQDFEQFKNLIAENLKQLSKIEEQEAQAREERRKEKELIKYKSCL